LYAVLSARDRLHRQEQSDRLNALVDLYASASGPQKKMKTAQRMPYEEKRLLLYNRNKRKLNELAKWIRKHKSLPTPKTNTKLSAFAAARYSSKVSEIIKELINEVIEKTLKANIDEVDNTMREEETAQMKEELEEFSEAVCEAIDRSRDWEDVDHWVSEEIETHMPWLDSTDAEIKTAIRLAIRDSSNKNVKEGQTAALLDFIWDSAVRLMPKKDKA
jgi:hypothetical protein